MKTVSADTMRTLDREAVSHFNIPAETLMERAGRGLAYELALFAEALPKRHARRFVLLAGKGNNGGDAFVAARLLPKLCPALEISLHCASPSDTLSGCAALMFKRLPKDVQISFTFDASDLREGDILVDGLLGTGFSGSLREPLKTWIEMVNASGLPVVAIDIPSGLNADDGTHETVVNADLTVSMALPKIGMLLGDGPALCGRLRLVDIGFPKELVAGAEALREMTFPSDLKPFFGREPFDSHKNRRGHLLVLGGSSSYPGAPALCAHAALKSGVGLLTLAVPEGATLQGALPNAVIFRKAPDSGKGVFTADSLPLVNELSGKSSAVVLGPGMSLSESCLDVLSAVLAGERPFLLDADALNLLALHPSLVERRRRPFVLTPHPGEMKRLLEGFGLAATAGREEQALALARRTGGVVVLKGCRTVVAAPDGRLALNGSGCPALATAGSGDCLSGVIGALLARGFDAFDAARAGVFIHGLAGELAFPCGSLGLVADEIPELVSAALKELSPVS